MISEVSVDDHKWTNWKPEVFGDLSQSSRLVEAVTQHLHQLYESGTEATLTRLL